MITAYRQRKSSHRQRGIFLGNEWSLLSDNDAKSEARAWLDDSGFGEVQLGRTLVLPHSGKSLFRELVMVIDPPPDLQMLIKLSFPSLVSLLQAANLSP